MSTFNSASNMTSYDHGEDGDGDDRIIAAGFHQLDLKFLAQRLAAHSSPRKSRLSAYFDGFMEFAKEPPSLSPSPISSRCSSPSRESVSHSSASDSEHSTAMDVVRRKVEHGVKMHKTKGLKLKRHLIKHRSKRNYRVGKIRNAHSMKTRSQRKSHRPEGLR